MRPLFADTFYFLALLNPHDSAHAKAVVLSQTRREPLLTTPWVITELADALSDPQRRAQCGRFVESLRTNPRVQIPLPTKEIFDAGWGLYLSRPDQPWSLTDCISFALMRKRGIKDALTGDHHFEQAGFRALLK